MFTQFLADAQALTGALPTLQTAAGTVANDLTGSQPAALAQLQADTQALTSSLTPVIEDITALQADLAALPQAVHGPLGSVWTDITPLLIQVLEAGGEAALMAVVAKIKAVLDAWLASTPVQVPPRAPRA